MSAVFKFIFRNIVSILLLVFGLIVGGYVIGMVDSARHVLFPETAAYVRAPETIINQIQGVGQLVTATSEVAKTDIKVEIHRGFLNFGYYSANHTAIGAIEAGVDFAAIDRDSLRIENGAYILTSPAPVLTSCRVEHIDQNQKSLTLLSADWDLVRQMAQAEAIAQFATEMIEAGILERAADEAELRLGEFLSGLTGRPAHIEFAEGDGESELPRSCKPYTPSGWAKDADGAWKRAD